MVRERWGTYSVKDHKNTQSLIADVLLYDRIVLPRPPNDEETERWEKLGWDPYLLEKRLEQLGPLSVKVPWSKDRQKIYKKKMDEIKVINFDAENMVKEVKDTGKVALDMTRSILEMTKYKLPKSISSIDVVSAYPSFIAFKKDFVLDKSGRKKKNLAFVFSHSLAIPNENNPEESLLKSIELSKSSDFKRKRRDFYRWQQEIINNGLEESAKREMVNLLQDYNRTVKEASKNLLYRVGFTIAGAATTILGGAIGDPIVTAAGAVGVAQFLTLDRKPVIDAGENRPAAMFHHIKKDVGLYIESKTV